MLLEIIQGWKEVYMLSTTSKTIPVVVRTVQWVAGMLGTAIILMFVVFAIGEVPPPALLLRPQTWALLVMLIGFILA
jgi:hypothetical protein